MGWIHEEIHYDCKHYRGEKPCVYRVNCPYCVHYLPMGYRVLIFKVGAMGDVLRTTAILPSLAADLASKTDGNIHVTWVVDPPNIPLLENNPYIDRLWTVDEETRLRLLVEKFDLALCFDKDPRCLALMTTCQAETKRGFVMGPEGTLRIANPESENALLLGLSDYFKFEKCEKTYQQIAHEMAKLGDAGELYVLHFTDEERVDAQARLHDLGAVRRPLIGINTGAGNVFPGKRWAKEKFAAAGRELAAKTGGTIVLLGGPDEVERNAWIAAQIGSACVDLGCDNPLRRFAAMVGLLDMVLTGDTMAMHVALAGKVPVVVLFGPTPHREVAVDARSEKIFRAPAGDLVMARVTEAESTIQLIEVDEVVAACLRVLGR
ncbi:MAG TPA: glycosyltransferase family 9 protein [bacterium]|nr:glycosyltransferase family 9 protein [bacterium]